MSAGNPYSAISAVVFDLDGTLIDSVPDIASAVNVALSEAGLRVLSTDDVASMVGNGSEDLIVSALGAASGAPPDAAFATTVHERFIAAYDREPCQASRLYPGTREMLDELLRHSVPLGICTNKPERITSQVLQRLDIAGYFASVVGGSARRPLKPAPDMLLQVLAELQADPGRSVMVGDSPADAGTAMAARTRLVLMTHGYSRGADLNQLGANAVLTHFSDLPGALARMTAEAA